MPYQQRPRPERGAKPPSESVWGWGPKRIDKCRQNASSNSQSPKQHMPESSQAASPTLPSWANEMRDLFRSGSAAQFLLHGSVFDVVPHGGKLLSVPSFLEQVMFASYDVVLRYDRSRGVRATRGGDDWGDYLQNALGREATTQTLMREPGSALELIDRYLLRTLNLQALPGGAGQGEAHRHHHRIRRVRRAARRRAPARWSVRRQHRQGSGLGQRSRDRPVQHRHGAAERRAARSQRSRRREPARRGAASAAPDGSGHARLPDGARDDHSFRICRPSATCRWRRSPRVSPG